MKCIAFHVETGKRCDRNVGRSRVAKRYHLCSTHSKSTVLCLMAGADDGENWTHVVTLDAAVRTELRRRLEPSFGPEVTARVLDAAASVPTTGDSDAYLTSVMAVVTPVLQAHLDARDATARALRGETNARNAKFDALIAQHIQWSQWPTLIVH